MLVLAGCGRQAAVPPPRNYFSEFFQQASIPVNAVTVNVQLPTSLQLAVTSGLKPTPVQTLSAGSYLVGSPEGFYSVAKAYSVPKNDEDPILLLGAALIKPGDRQVAIDVESTAIHMVAYWDWIDWVMLGLPSLEAAENLVRQHPRYGELVGRIRDALLRNQSPYEDEEIISLSAEIAGDLVADRIVSLPNTVEPQTQHRALPTLSFVGSGLEVTNNTAITWAVGWMDYNEERILFSRAEILPEADLSLRWLTGPSKKVLGLSGSPGDRYLLCLVPSAPGGWAPTNGNFPLQDLLHVLNGEATRRGWVEAGLLAAGFIPGVGVVADFADAALDQDVVSMLAATANAGVEVYLHDVDRSIQETQDKLNLHRIKLQAARDALDKIRAELGDPNLRKSEDAQWKKLADKYKAQLIELQETYKKMGKLSGSLFNQDGSVNKRYYSLVGEPVLKWEAGSLRRQIVLEEWAAQRIEQKLGRLKGIKSFGRFLVVPSVFDALAFVYDVVAYSNLYACYEVRTNSRGIRYTLGPNMEVTPAQISNGKKDETYVFRIKVLHLIEQTANFSLSWNFGDGATGSRNVSAGRSPHEESISHAYKDSGAYGLTIQLTAGANKVSQVIPIYIEMPEQSNDYNLNICNVWRAANSGGYGITRDDWDISAIPDGAVFDIAFDTYSIPDRIFVEYPVGTQVLDTGWRGDSWYNGDPKYPGGISGPGMGQFDNIFRKIAGQDTFRVIVVGPDTGTAWDYRIRCRTGTSSQSLGPAEVSPDPEVQRLFRPNPER
ncbi:PKD domain-containing protein [Thermus antranikianii]|nr:PKD domain-containing protein [Thermus antranikianii]